MNDQPNVITIALECRKCGLRYLEPPEVLKQPTFESRCPGCSNRSLHESKDYRRNNLG